jgi:hypothetical protein
MADKIQIKRGLKVNKPDLTPGELFLAIDANEEEVHIGSDSRQVRLVHDKEIEATNAILEKESDIGSPLGAIWEPPVMPDTFRNNGLVPSSYEPDVQLAALMDPLVDGEYVTKRSIGKSQDTVNGVPLAAGDVYDIWCYEFTPKNYEKTIFITTLTHGNEYTGFYWWTQFADLLVNHWHKHPALKALRKTVRIVSVPIVNPWGHKNQKRFNASGVDISRNFNYNWGNVFDEYPQGSAAFSEAEARAIRDLMAEIAPECSAALDFHTTLSEGSTDHILYYPRFLDNDINPYIALIEQLKKAGETTAFATTVIPTLTNWGIFTHGFNSANPEFYNGLKGSTRDSVEMTRAMRFFGNFVLHAARIPFKNRANVVHLPEFSSIKFDHRVNGGTIDFTTTTLTTQASKTAIKFKAKNEGVFEVDGTVVVSVTADCEVLIVPHLYQVKSPDFPYVAPDLTDQFDAFPINMKAGQELPIPIQALIRCHKTNQVAADNTNDRTQEIVFQLRTQISAGVGSIKFIKAKAKLTPTTSGDSFKRYTLNPTLISYPVSEGVVYEF